MLHTTRTTVPRWSHLRGAVVGGCLAALVLATALLHLQAAKMAERQALAVAHSKPESLLQASADGSRAPLGGSTLAAPGVALVERQVSNVQIAAPPTSAHGSYLDQDGGSILRLTSAGKGHLLPPMPQEPTWSERTEVLLHMGGTHAPSPLYGLWSPATAPRGVAILVGGTSAGVAGPCRGIHRVASRRHGLYNYLAAVLPAGEGVSVLQFSYRVPGWRGIAQSRKDMSAALHWVSEHSPGVPIGLVGHSMGAAVVLAPENDPLDATGVAIGAVATIAGVSRQIARTISPSIELLVLHDPADSNVAVSSAWDIYSRHSGAGRAHKRLRYARYNVSKHEADGDGSVVLLPRAAAHNFELGGACAQLVWPEMIQWVHRWRL